MKKPWLAGILSFVFPGLGHLYLGKVLQGVLLIILYIGAVISAGYIVGLIIMPLVWLYAIINSINLARNRNSVTNKSYSV